MVVNNFVLKSLGIGTSCIHSFSGGKNSVAATTVIMETILRETKSGLLFLKLSLKGSPYYYVSLEFSLRREEPTW
jgi:hypothetical protein